MKKKIVSLLMALALCLGLAAPAIAASDEALGAADRLYELGLFQGVGTNEDGTPDYDLDRPPNRMEAVTLLVRLLGKEAEALTGTWTIPFTDVADWAKPYVGYAYANSLTAGTSATTFSGTDTVSAVQYLTFVLRALGYSSETDFTWDMSYLLTDALSITDGRYDADSAFLRGDAVMVSAKALYTNLKDSDKTLLEAIEEALASAPAVPVDPPDPEPVAAEGVIHTFTYSGNAWREGEAPIGYKESLITAKVEVISKYEAVFSMEAPDIGPYMWYGAQFVREWTERQWVNNNTMEVDVRREESLHLEFFIPGGEADSEFGAYTAGFGETYPQLSYTDAQKGDGRMSVRVTLPEDSEFDFELFKDFEFRGHMITSYG